MDSRCAFCFHPLPGAAGDACRVCAAAAMTTSPFGSSSAKPSPSAFSYSAPTATTSPPAPAFGFSASFGQAASASPFSAIGFSTLQSFLGETAPPSPFALPPVSANASPYGVAQPLGSLTESPGPVFDDDEPVEDPPAATLGGVQEAPSSTTNAPLVLNTHCELPAIARGSARDSFAVLVHAKAPAADHAAPRPSLDLVTVLDVSGSMAGSKLALLKEAMGFVIDKLGPADRLSVVSFSHQARRETRLTRMSDAGKASTKLAVEYLYACGNTDILKGLDTAAKVLDGRRHKNTVASVILLSDGQDTCNRPFGFNYGQNKSYDYLVPPSFVANNHRSTPIHTFGFGTDHDAKEMHAVAEATGGTYSFIENQAVVQDAFAQCIGGLLSVAVQEAWIAVTCPHPDVRVRSIKSGRYESRVLAYGRAASVDVGELYADEERRFLLFVDVPRVAEEEDVTRLIRVSCTYKDSATGKSMQVDGGDAVVRRPAEVTSEEGQKPSMEVQVERFRVEAAEDIAAARAAAERGDHAEAVRILDRRQEAARTGDLLGDARCAAVVYELAELSARVSTQREYEQTGRSSMLSGMSAHAQQRAVSVNLCGAMASPTFGATPAPAFGATPAPAFGAGCAMPTFGAAFATPAMVDMVGSSRKIREEREQQHS
ncbi:E3 ubiquitin-protein ligase WAV3-like [Lolium rigidum]|uniref:E3 ubiquitin-protein ligase WAV3-like n=1 Tax=Lolium rigidum TaxID=89674 RepID=UPI001F5DFBCC|nr:E3 ubiquitin-protein ligase WAV3-like [Lolium rigidum]